MRDGYDRLEYWVGLAIVAACFVYVFIQLGPSLVLRNTTITGGDTGAHVWFPDFLIDHFLPWRVAGWSNDFYAGFPAGQFYFPFPAVLIALLDVVLPYNIAFKLVTVARTARAAGRRVRVRPRHPRAAPDRAAVRGRRHRLPVLQGRRRRDHDVRLPHHGRQPRRARWRASTRS